MTLLDHLTHEVLNHFGWKVVEYVCKYTADAIGKAFTNWFMAPIWSVVDDLVATMKTVMVVGGIVFCVGGILVYTHRARSAGLSG